MATVLENRGQIIAANYLDAVTGVWLFVSPFALALDTTPVVLWNNMIVGFVVVVASLIGAQQLEKAAGYDFFSGLLGLWMIGSPWALSFANQPTALANNVASGAVILALAIWGVAASDATLEQ